MTPPETPSPLSALHLQRSQEAPGAPDQVAHNEATAAAGVAFRALLERLEKTAKDLDEASASIEDPRELGPAVATARHSVAEAVVAGSDLLEAYRAAQARANESLQTSPTTEARPATGQGDKR